MTPVELFSGPAFRVREIGAGDVPALQRFFEANPEYFIRVSGNGPGKDEAQIEFDDRPPADWPYTGKRLIRFEDDGGAMVAMADVLSDMFAEGVWHIGLFIVATSLHGSGTAKAMYAELEAWMRRGGARWLRLGVVEGNARAERFWERAGYAEVRRREGIEMGRRVNTVRIMAKPLANGNMREYLGMVARDRPEAP